MPGLARTLFVGLFLGEGDWNLDNWGFGSGAGGMEVRRVDVTGFDFGTNVEDLLTPEGLLKAAKWVPFSPQSMDKAELATVIRAVVERGEEAIKRLGAEFKPEFEGLGATEIYEGYLAQLLERHKRLCSAAKS